MNKISPFSIYRVSTLHLVLASSVASFALLGIKSNDLAHEFLWPAAHAESTANIAPKAPVAADVPVPSNTVAVSAATATPPVVAPISDEERHLLQDLLSRKEDIDRREKILNDRQSAFAATEKSLDGRVQHMNELQDSLQKIQDAAIKKNDENWQGLVSVYETMKPGAAAAILNNLEMPVLLQIFDRMKDRKAAVILSQMDTDRARLVTVELAKMRAMQNSKIASNS
jgi:flagellar motility protein MotE (MotC chaperone)